MLPWKVSGRYTHTPCSSDGSPAWKSSHQCSHFPASHTQLASLIHYFVSVSRWVCVLITCSVCSALWKSRRKEARLNLYMLLILDRSVITKYILLAVSASGRYASLSYRHTERLMLHWCHLLFNWFLVSFIIVLFPSITWSSDVCRRCDSVSDWWIRALLALVWFRDSISSLFSRIFPWAVANVFTHTKHTVCCVYGEKHAVKGHAGIGASVPPAVTPPAERAESSSPLPVAGASFFRSPALVSPAGWSTLAAKHTHMR